MSFVPVFLNLLLAVLLLAALAVGIRLERRLKDLRKSHHSFSLAVQELNSASVRAQAGLAQLRIAAQEAGDLLGERIAQAREVTAQIDEKITVALDLASAPLTVPMAKPEAKHAPEPEPVNRLWREPPPSLAAPRAPLRRPEAQMDDDLFNEPAREQAPPDVNPFGGRR